MARFLLYWQPSYADEGCAERWRIARLGSYHFRRVRAGDEVWLVTARRGRLSLIGHLEIAEVLTPAESVKRIPAGERWHGAHVALARRGTAVRMREVPLTFAEVARLRFESAARDRLEVGDGRVSAMQLQTMRRLTARSSAMLARAWRRKLDGR